MSLQNKYVTLMPDGDVRVEFEPPRDVEICVKATSKRTQNVWVSSNRKDDLMTGKGRRTKDGVVHECGKKSLKNAERLYFSFDYAGSDPVNYSRSSKTIFDASTDVVAREGTVYIILRSENLPEKEDDPGLPEILDAPGLNGALVYITFKPLEAELAQTAAWQ